MIVHEAALVFAAEPEHHRHHQQDAAQGPERYKYVAENGISYVSIGHRGLVQAAIGPNLPKGDGLCGSVRHVPASCWEVSGVDFRLRCSNPAPGSLPQLLPEAVR